MAVELLRAVRGGRTYARFVMDGHWDDRDVSVVGPFNDWTPGIDVLRPDHNGTRSALVEVREGSDLVFRYLATGDDWFDDPDADDFSERGSTVYWPDSRPNGASANPPAKKAATKKAAPPASAKKVGAAKKTPPAAGG